MQENEVVSIARRNGVSIFVVYAMGYEKWMFEMLARETGGAVFNLKNMRKASDAPPGPRIFDVLRSHYTLSVAGNLALGQKLKIEIKGPEKLFASALPLD